MKNLYKGLEVNENDTFGTAIAKGLTIGLIQGGVTIGALAMTALIAGKLEKKIVESNKGLEAE